MAGYENFQVDRNKYSNGIKDVYAQGKNYNKTNENLSKNEKLKDGFKLWTGFYRSNIHRFAIDYLQLNLFTFQLILLHMMNISDFFMFLAARGMGKSYLIAIFCCCRAILFPNSSIIVASGTKGQSKLIITQKVLQLYNSSPNLAREIKDIKTSSNECVVHFQNGSKIEAVTSTDNARGFRCNILIMDEFRLIPVDRVNKILRPFLNVNRQPPYLTNPSYSHLQEENKEIYISSAWYKSDWIYDKFKSFVSSMIRGKSYFVCGLNYKLSMLHGLLSKTRVEQMRSEDDLDDIGLIA